MSHWMKDANIIVTDISLFEESCADQGLSVTRLDVSQEFMNRYTRTGVLSNIVVHDHNAIATECSAQNAAFLCQQDDPMGGYHLATDTYRNDIGARAKKALYSYAANVITQNAMAQGMQVVDKEVDAKGEISLVLARV